MSSLLFNTRVYRYSRYANWMLIIYCLIVPLFFLISSQLSNTGIIICLTIIFGLPIFVGVFPKSFFSIRSWDERPLSISENEIRFGEDVFPITQLQEFNIYIFSFQNFRHLEMGPDGTEGQVLEYGDKNTVSFKYEGKNYEFTFYIDSFQHYLLLYQIVGAWQANAVHVHARSAFEHVFILDQVKKFN